MDIYFKFIHQGNESYSIIRQKKSRVTTENGAGRIGYQ